MIAAIIISILSILGMIVCVFACPVLKIKNFEMQTFWFAPTLGAIILLIFGLVDANVVFSSMIENSSVNPLEILVLFISMVFFKCCFG